jgi:hypothetical protein
VANLNADRLDGIDSGGFARGKAAQIVSAHVRTPIDPNFPEITILTVPGLGTLTAQCHSDFKGIYVGFRHTTSHWLAYDKNDGTDPVVVNSGSFSQLMAGKTGTDHWTLAIGQGIGPSAVIATLDIYTSYGVSDCTVQAQAIISQGS